MQPDNLRPLGSVVIAVIGTKDGRVIGDRNRHDVFKRVPPMQSSDRAPAPRNPNRSGFGIGPLAPIPVSRLAQKGNKTGVPIRDI